jgi:hypothetical protein
MFNLKLLKLWQVKETFKRCGTAGPYSGDIKKGGKSGSKKK